MSRVQINFKESYAYSEFTYSSASVDSTTQGLLFTSTNALDEWVITNTSTNKVLWVKPADNTATKHGILIRPLLSLKLPIALAVAVYGIMDGGGATTIQILRAH